MPRFLTLLALSTLLLPPASAAEVAIPNTKVAYEITKDPMTPFRA